MEARVTCHFHSAVSHGVCARAGLGGDLVPACMALGTGRGWLSTDLTLLCRCLAARASDAGPSGASREGPGGWLARRFRYWCGGHAVLLPLCQAGRFSVPPVSAEWSWCGSRLATWSSALRHGQTGWRGACARPWASSAPGAHAGPSSTG